MPFDEPVPDSDEAVYEGLNSDGMNPFAGEPSAEYPPARVRSLSAQADTRRPRPPATGFIPSHDAAHDGPAPTPIADGPPDLWHYERAARLRGHTLVAGLDEVGRGPLAGPVVAACVILPDEFCLEGIRDSKTLSARQRERAEARIRAEALAIGLGSLDAGEIDRINILQAAREAMRQALRTLTPALAPTIALVDGLFVPSLPCPRQVAIVKGDSRSASIAAASIVAKVYRDTLLCAWDADYPEYGFAKHKGYGSPAHLAALRQHGPCPLHRRSFAPVRACLSHAEPE